MKCNTMFSGAGILILCSMVIALVPSIAEGAVPQLINFQGILRDGSGNPVGNGSYSVIFTIYDAPTAGTNLWSETQSVNTVNGLFTVLLGSGPLPLDYSIFNDSTRWLGIKVGADPEMTPRQRLSSVGFSYNSSEWTSAAQDLFRLNGNVGIGTAAPNAKLDVFLSGSHPLYLTGVRGSANNSSSGDAYGGFFSSSASGGGISYGVYGIGGNYGVYGDGLYGVYGKSSSGTGVKAYSVSGVGVDASGGSVGVYADGGTRGVWGNSLSGYGVLGTSSSGTGVNALSSSGPGVVASGGTYGGRFTGTDILSYGVDATGGNIGGYFIGTDGASFGVYASGGLRGGRFRGTGGGSYGVDASGGTYGVYGTAANDGGIAVFGNINGHFGTYGGYFQGDVKVERNLVVDVNAYVGGNAYITGTVFKGGLAFKIDHPLDPSNKYLNHSGVESPDMKNIYDGVVITDANSNATVTLPEWFGALNRDFRYQLTVIGEFAQAIISEKIKGNQFAIKTDKPNIEVSWQVTGIRQDAYANAHRIQVEEEKPAAERGKYLHPTEQGVSETLGMQYEMTQKMAAERKQMEEQQTKMEAERKQQEDQRAKMEQERLIHEQKIKGNK